MGSALPEWLWGCSLACSFSVVVTKSVKRGAIAKGDLLSKHCFSGSDRGRN